MTLNDGVEMKNYVCIGGSQGIGLETIKILLDEDCHIFCVSRNKGDLPLSEKITHISLDVLTYPTLEFLDTVERIDGYVYFPGSISLNSFSRFSKADFINDFELNVTANVELLKQVLPKLKKSDAPSVVFFSTVAVQTGMTFHSLVSTSKGAVEGLTRSLAAELAPKIRVNCVAPSLTETPLARKIVSNERMKKASEEKHPLKRIGEASEVAQACHYLLTSKSSWVTGQILRVDGGMSSIK